MSFVYPQIAQKMSFVKESIVHVLSAKNAVFS